MTLWELAACVDGVNVANEIEGGALEPPTDAEFDAMLAADAARSTAH